jgi:peptidoglycan/xylan/chitin deacetylase (PgdA/CDA1 family)
MLCAVSVDLDEIPNYHAIHGLSPPAADRAHAVYDTGLDRLEAFARAHHMPLTFFAVGRDLAREQNAERMRKIAERGHEIGNHSLSHRHDLSTLPHEEMLREIQGGADAIEAAVGTRPVGFRAPGYNFSDRLAAALLSCGVEYDSSVFPCPYYYAARVGALGFIRAAGRKSGSRLGNPAVLGAPARPYRVGTPYWRRGKGILELPIQVTRKTRLPFIGTALTLAGPWGARMMTRDVVGEQFVNLELHGLDVLSGDDGLDELVPHQLDLRIPVERKLEALSVVMEALRHAGYRFVRLGEAAAELSAKSDAGAR